MKHSQSVKYAARGILTILVLTLGPNHARYANAQQSCDGACIEVGPRLVAIDSEEGFLLDAILGGLLGSSVDLDVLDWQAIGAGEINLLGFLDTLQADLGLSSTSEVLTADVTLEDFFIAAAKVAQADGNTLLANALNALAADVSGLSGTIKLGDLLAIDFPEGALADIDISVLALINGLVQLYNYENVATTPSPITVPGDSLGLLGLDGVADSLTIWAQVIEPKVIVCDTAVATAHTAAIRLKVDVDLVSADLDFFPLLGITASLEQIGLYLEVARADAIMTLVDILTPQVDITATPGVVDAYIGSLPDSVFWNRELPSDTFEVLLDSMVVGNINFSLLSESLDAFITAKSSAQGTSGSSNLSFFGAYPETQTVGNSATFLSSLLTDLINNLEVNFEISDPIPAALATLVNNALAALPGIVNPVIENVLDPILANLVDPLLRALGIGIGEADVTVLGVTILPACQECDLAIEKLVDETSVAIGDTITFSVVLTNNGPDDASGVVVGDTLEAGFMYVSSSATNGSYDESTGLWDVGQIPSGTMDTLAIMVEVGPSGPYFNRAQVTDADQPDPNSVPGNMGDDPIENDEGRIDDLDVSPLPVELIDFSALQVDERSVSLTWSTATETNNAGFDVQLQRVAACEGGCDAEAGWSSIAFVEGAGNSANPLSYTYRVDDVEVGNVRFRLKQVDFDGAFEYSPVVELFVEMPSAYELSTAYPNPFRSSTSIDLTLREQDRVSVDVFDATGRMVVRLFEGSVGAYDQTRLQIDGDNLPAGLYMIRVTGTTFSETRKVMLVK